MKFAPLTRLGLRLRHPLPKGRGSVGHAAAYLLPDGEKVAERSEAG